MGWIRSSGLCGVHKGLNGDLLSDILSLVRREVTTMFRQFDKYPELIQPVESDILVSLRALKGMWTKPSLDNPVASQALPYQINRCSACILARIAADGEMIRNLRVVLQSRTRTRRNHRAPTLMVFVDECIRQFGGDDADELFGTASNLAFHMKATRKECVKAWYRDHKDSRHHRRKRRDERRSHDRNSDGLADTRPRRSHVPSIAVIPEDNVAIHNFWKSSTSGSSDGYCQYGSVGRTSDSSGTSKSRSMRASDRSGRSTAPSPESSPSSAVSRGQSLYLHPERSIASVSLYEPFPGANNSTTSIHSWRDVKRELSMVRTCRQIANDNPYYRPTPVPEARVEPLRISKVESRSEEQSRMSMADPWHYESQENGNSFLDYSSSGYWTDASLASDDEGPAPESQVQFQPLPQGLSLGNQPEAAMTTWSLMCDQGNVI
jgi:hypothetical protein